MRPFRVGLTGSAAAVSLRTAAFTLSCKAASRFSTGGSSSAGVAGGWPRSLASIERRELGHGVVAVVRPSERLAAGVHQLSRQLPLDRGDGCRAQVAVEGAGGTDVLGVMQHVQGQDPTRGTHQHQLPPLAEDDTAEGPLAAGHQGVGEDGVGGLGRQPVGQQIQRAAGVEHGIDLTGGEETFQDQRGPGRGGVDRVRRRQRPGTGRARRVTADDGAGLDRTVRWTVLLLPDALTAVGVELVEVDFIGAGRGAENARTGTDTRLKRNRPDQLARLRRAGAEPTLGSAAVGVVGAGRGRVETVMGEVLSLETVLAAQRFRAQVNPRSGWTRRSGVSGSF